MKYGDVFYTLLKDKTDATEFLKVFIANDMILKDPFLSQNKSTEQNIFLGVLPPDPILGHV